MSKQSENKWQALFEEQESSGLSVVAFCKQRDIIPQTFYSQRYKHKKRAVTGTAEQSDFIAVRKIGAVCEFPQTITVQCGEVSILVPASFDITRLVTLVEGLR